MAQSLSKLYGQINYDLPFQDDCFTSLHYSRGVAVGLNLAGLSARDRNYNLFYYYMKIHEIK